MGCTLMGAQMFTMVIGWLVLEMTDSKLWVGIVNGLPAAAIIFFSLAGGVLTDRIDPKIILTRVRMALAGLTFLIAFLITADAIQLWHVLLLAIVVGGTNAMGMPASRTFVFDIVGKERLFSAISFNSVVSNLGIIIGPSVAGILIAGVGTDAAFYLVGGAYLVALVTMMAVNSGQRNRQDRQTSALGDLIEGFAYVGRTPHVAWLLLLGFLVLFAGVYFPLLPIYARDVLNVGPQGFGLLMGAAGVGSLAGSIFLTIRGNVTRKGLVLVAAAVTWAVGMMVFAFSREFYLSMACVFFMGVAAAYWVNTMNTVLQTSVPEEMRGRVMSIFTMTLQVLPLGWLLGGVLATFLGNEAALVIGGTVFLTFNLLAYASSRQLREMTWAHTNALVMLEFEV